MLYWPYFSKRLPSQYKPTPNYCYNNIISLSSTQQINLSGCLFSCEMKWNKEKIKRIELLSGLRAGPPAKDSHKRKTKGIWLHSLAALSLLILQLSISFSFFASAPERNEVEWMKEEGVWLLGLAGFFLCGALWRAAPITHHKKTNPTKPFLRKSKHNSFISLAFPATAKKWRIVLFASLAYRGALGPLGRRFIHSIPLSFINLSFSFHSKH